MKFTEKHCVFRRAVAAIALVAFIMNFVLNDAWAAVDVIKPPFSFLEQTPSTFAHLNIDTFTVPAHLGEIRYSFKGTSDKLIIHVQDAHCNAYAQHKVADIFEYLTGEYGLSVLNLEGGDGEYDLDTFTAISGEAIRREVADYFLEKGEINGAEYFAINNPDAVKLWGIENTDLYIANLDIFRDSLVFKPEAEAYLDNISTALGALKLKMYSPELAAVDKVYSEYKAGNMEFKEYVDFLVERAESEKIDIEEYPNLFLLVKSMEKEKYIDFKKASTERTQLIDVLKRGLSKNEARELVLKTVEFKTKKISRKDFYNYLLEKGAALGLDVRQFPQLTGYVEYVSIFESADRLKVMFELDALERYVEEKLCGTEEQLKLVDLSRSLTLTRNIFNFTLTRNDYTYYLDNKKSFEVSGYADFIAEESPKYRLNPALNPNLSKLDGYLRKVEKFFEYSFKRDNVFLENMIFEEKRGDTESAILMTGGFHTENLCSMFEAAGISYVSILPKFTSEQGYENPYFALLAGEATGVQQMLKPVLARAGMLQVASKLNTILGDAVWGALEISAFDLAVQVRAAITEMHEKSEGSGDPRQIVLMRGEKEVYSLGEGRVKTVQLAGLLETLGYDGSVLSDPSADIEGPRKGIIDSAARDRRVEQLGQRWGEFLYDNFEGPVREELFYTGIPVVIGMAAAFVAAQYAAPLFAAMLAISRVIFLVRHLPRSALEESDGDIVNAFSVILSRLLVPSIISGAVLAMVPASTSGLALSILIHVGSNLVLQPLLNAVFEAGSASGEISPVKGVIHRNRRVRRAEPVKKKVSAKFSEESKGQRALKSFLSYVPMERTEVENIGRLNSLRKNKYLRRFSPVKHKKVLKDQFPDGAEYLDKIDTILGRSGESDYKLGEVLGEGGFGKVFKALDGSSGETVAIKLLKPSEKREVGQKLKFIQEYAKMRTLSDMDSIPEARAIGSIVTPEGDEYYYMVMDYVEGASLHEEMYERMRSGRWYTSDQIMLIVWQLVSFADEFRKRGFVHGDLKPENVIIRYDQGGVPTLSFIDLGTSLYLPKGWRHMDYSEGTYHYMSKATHNGTYSLHTDLFAIGCILYELLSGGTLPYPSFEAGADFDQWIETRRTSLEQGVTSYRSKHEDKYAFADLMKMLLELDREKDGKVPRVDTQKVYKKLIQIEDQLREDGLIADLLARQDINMNRRVLEHLMNDRYRSESNRQGIIEGLKDRFCGMADAAADGSKRFRYKKGGTELTSEVPARIQDKRTGAVYNVESFIGSGGAAEVYKADMDGEKVALKVLSVGKEMTTGEYYNLLAFFKEYLILSGMGEEETFVGAKGIGSYSGADGKRYYYIAMELADSDLSSAMPGLSEEEKIDIAGQLLYAGKLLQEKGLIWRDIKPENILIKAEEDAGGQTRKRIMISDPGIALYSPNVDAWGRRGEGVGDMSREEVAGTPWYMSKEQFAGKFNSRTDLYAMGNVLYELFYGKVKYLDYMKFSDKDGNHKWDAWLQYRDIRMEDVTSYDESSGDAIRKFIAGMLVEDGFRNFDDAYFAFADVMQEQRFKGAGKIAKAAEAVREKIDTEDDDSLILREESIGDMKTQQENILQELVLNGKTEINKGVIKNPLRTYFIGLSEKIGVWMDRRAGDESGAGSRSEKMRSYGEGLYDNLLGPLLEESIFYVGLPMLLMSVPALGLGLHPVIFISRAIFIFAHFLHKAKGNRLIVPALISLSADIFAVPWGLTLIGFTVSSSIHIAANAVVVPIVNTLLRNLGSKFRVEKGIITNIDAFEEHFLKYNPHPELEDNKEASNREIAGNRNWEQVFPRRVSSDNVRLVVRSGEDGRISENTAPEVIYISSLGNKIEISSEIVGDSNFGTIWRGKAVGGKFQNKEVAVKILAPEASDLARIKFKQQYLAMRRAERRGVPGALRAYDAGYYERDGKRHYFIVEEFVPGIRMDRLIEQQPELITPELTLDIAEQALVTLSKLHESGILHLDINPENIFISFNAEGKAKVTIGDFGLAFFSSEGKVSLLPGASIGDPEYLLDRTYKSGDYDRNTDLYALGMTLYRFFHRGIDPFVDSSLAETPASMKNRIDSGMGMYSDPEIYPMEDFIRRLLQEGFTGANEAVLNLVAVRAGLKQQEKEREVYLSVDGAEIIDRVAGAVRERRIEEPFYVPVSVPGDDLGGKGSLGAIHNGGMEEEAVRKITDDIAVRSRSLSNEESAIVLEALVGINERLRELSSEEIDPDSGEEVKGLIRSQLVELLKGLSDPEEGSEVVTFSSEVGVVDSENFVLAAVLGNGKVALVDGVFSDAILGKKEYLEEVLFHEMLAMAYPEEGSDDHRARYADLSSGYVSPVEGLTSIQRKFFPKDSGTNILKYILRNYVEHYLSFEDAVAYKIAEAMRNKEGEVLANREQLERWKSILEGATEWEGDMAYLPDIHGNADGLRSMIDDLLRKGVRRFVFTGDYMDRDEKSLEVIDILRELSAGRYEFDGKTSGEVQVEFLFGNHDQLFVESMFGDVDSYTMWILNGGTSVLRETSRYKEDKNFAQNVDLIHDALLEAEREGRERQEALFSNIEKVMTLRSTVRGIPELKEAAIWMLVNLRIYHKSEIGGLSMHGGVPLDRTGYVISDYRGKKGMAAIESMQDSMDSLRGDLLVEAIYNASEGSMEKMADLDNRLDSIISEGLSSLFEDVEKNKELLDAIYEGMEKASINARRMNILERLHSSDLSPVSVRRGWFDLLSNSAIVQEGFSDWVLGQVEANIIIFGHTPMKGNILNVDDKIFGIDTGMAKAMYGGGSNLVVSKDGIYANSIEGDTIVSDIIMGKNSLLKEISRRISLINNVLARIRQIKILRSSPDIVREKDRGKSLSDTVVMIIRPKGPEQGITDWLESKRKGRSLLLWGGVIAPIIEEIIYGGLPILLGGLTRIAFTGSAGVVVLISSSFIFEIAAGLFFISHHGGSLFSGAVKVPAIIAVARLALLPLLTVNPALYLAAAIAVHSTINMLFLLADRTREARGISVEGVSEYGDRFAVMNMGKGRSLEDIIADIAAQTNRDVILSDGNLSQGYEGVDQEKALSSNIMTRDISGKVEEYKVRSHPLGEHEMLTIDHHFSDRVFTDKTATVLLVEYFEEMRGRAPPEELIASLSERLYVTTHKDTDSLLAYLVIHKYEDLVNAGVDLDLIRSLAYYSDHFTMTEGISDKDKTTIRILTDLFYSAFFVNDRSFGDMAEEAVDIIKGVRESVRGDGTLSNVILNRSLPEGIREDYYEYERELEKDRLTLPIMESVLRGDSFENFQIAAGRVRDELSRINYYREETVDDPGVYLDLGVFPDNREEYESFAEELSTEQGLSIERVGIFRFMTVRSKRGINNKVFLDYINDKKEGDPDFRDIKVSINIQESGEYREVRLRTLGPGFRLTKNYARLNEAENRKAYDRWKEAGSIGKFEKYQPWGGSPERGAAAAVYGGVSYLTPNEIIDAMLGRSAIVSSRGSEVRVAVVKPKEGYRMVGQSLAEAPIVSDPKAERDFLDYDSTAPDADLTEEELSDRKVLAEQWRRVLAPRVERSDISMTIRRAWGEWEVPSVIKSSVKEGVTYKVKEVIRVGGEGAVVKARVFSGEEDSGEDVAIKVSRPVNSMSRKVRFLQEIGVLRWADEKYIPSIMSLEDSGSFTMDTGAEDAGDDEYLFQVLQYYPGGTLKTDIKDGRQLSEQEIKVFLRTFGVVAKLHNEGVVHADLKPDNLFVERNWSGEIENVVLGDFGIHVHSSSYDAEEDGVLEINKKRGISTEAYRWPGEEGEYTEKTDLYAMGCILTELVRGKSVWQEIREKKMDAPEKYSDLNVSLEEQIEFINAHEEFARDPMLRLASMLIAGPTDLVHRRRGIMRSRDLLAYIQQEGLLSEMELSGPLTLNDYRRFNEQPLLISEANVEVLKTGGGIELFFGEESYAAEGNIGRGIDHWVKEEWVRAIKTGSDELETENQDLIEEIQFRADGILKYEKVIRKVLSDRGLSETNIEEVISSLASVSDSFSWFNARVEGYEKYLLGSENALAVNLIEYLKSLEENSEGVRFLVEEYILHEALERTELDHYEIIDITGMFFRRAASESPGGTLLGQALRKFINENARDDIDRKVSLRDMAVVEDEMRAMGAAANEGAWAIVNVENPAMSVSGGDNLKKHEELLNSSVDLLTGNIKKDQLIDMIRKLTGEKLLSWSDLSPNIKISYHGEGAHKYVLRVELFRIDGTELNILLAVKKEKETGDIQSREIRDLIRIKGKGVPKYVGTLTGRKGKTWLIEEFVEGDTVAAAAEKGYLTPEMKKEIITVLMSIAVDLDGEVPRDIHAENFIVRKDTDEIVMVDLGDRRITLSGASEVFEKNRMLFLAILVAIYGGRENPEDNYLIFDAISESDAFSEEEAVEMISLAVSEIDDMGIAAAGKMFYDSGRTLFPDFGADKNNIEPLIEFAEFFRESLKSWLSDSGKHRGSPEEETEKQAAALKEVIGDVYAARGKVALNDLRKNQVDIVVMPGSDLYVAQQQNIEKKTARKLHRDYGQETLPFSYKYDDNWRENLTVLMDERVLDALISNKEKGSRMLVYLPVTKDEAQTLFEIGGLFSGDKYEAVRDKITIIPEADIPPDGVIDTVMHIVLAKSLLNYKRFESKDFGGRAKLSPESIENIIRLLSLMVQPGSIPFGEYEGRESELLDAILGGNIEIRIKRIDFQEIIDWKEAQDEVLRSL